MTVRMGSIACALALVWLGCGGDDRGRPAGGGVGTDGPVVRADAGASRTGERAGGGSVTMAPPPQPDAGTSTPTVTDPVPDPDTGLKRFFVTSGTTTGDMGGLAGADAFCQLYADASEVGGEWVAVLSTSTVSFRDRITGDGPWVDLAGNRLFNNRANLLTTPLVTPNVDERGEEVWGDVWTGTRSGGASSDDTCRDWFGSSYYDAGVVGDANADDSSWIEDYWDYCDSQHHLYCVEL